MPELPEVETTCRGIRPHLQGQTIQRLIVRQKQLRWPIPSAALSLKNSAILAVRRRAKFLLLDTSKGQLLLHLGMSGSLRVLPQNTPHGKHDHVDVLLSNNTLLRFNDPRRFGALLWSDLLDQHPLLQRLGPEPLSEVFSSDYLWQQSRHRKQAIKTFLMSNQVVVGIGNIYAQESLFRAGIHPARAAGRISRQRYQQLTDTIKAVLNDAIAAGGTTLRDFTRENGQPGYFAQALTVYGRQGQPCQLCKTSLKGMRQGQRSTSYCPHCQT